MTSCVKPKYVTGGCLVIEMKVTKAVEERETETSLGVERLQPTQRF